LKQKPDKPQNGVEPAKKEGKAAFGENKENTML
jgi:hypothetical protein